MIEAEEVFYLVAALDGNEEGMTKEELITAHNGDFKPFATLWVDEDGTVSLEASIISICMYNMISSETNISYNA